MKEQARSSGEGARRQVRGATHLLTPSRATLMLLQHPVAAEHDVGCGGGTRETEVLFCSESDLPPVCVISQDPHGHCKKKHATDVS